MTAETFDTAPPADSDSAAISQSAITAEILQIEAGYRASGVPELQPRLDYPPYRSSLLRHPTKDLHHADPESDRAVGAGASATATSTPSRPT